MCRIIIFILTVFKKAICPVGFLGLNNMASQFWTNGLGLFIKWKVETQQSNCYRTHLINSLRPPKDLYIGFWVINL